MMGENKIETLEQLAAFARDRGRLAEQRGEKERAPLPRAADPVSLVTGKLQRIDFAAPSPGQYNCNACGVTLKMPGACRQCFGKRRWEERLTALIPAYASIPPRFRGARFEPPSGNLLIGLLDRGIKMPDIGPNGENLHEFVKDPSATKKARYVDPLVDTVLIMPDAKDPVSAGHGKTTLAACILHALLDNAVEDEDLFERCGLVRFIPAFHLAPPDGGDRERYLRAVHDAMNATVVVIDDMGQELLGAPNQSPLAAQRRRAIVEIIQERHNAGRGLILTTAICTLGEIDSQYNGGGIGRRVYKDGGGGGSAKMIVVRSEERLKAAHAEIISRGERR